MFKFNKKNLSIVVAVVISMLFLLPGFNILGSGEAGEDVRPWYPVKVDVKVGYLSYNHEKISLENFLPDGTANRFPPKPPCPYQNLDYCTLQCPGFNPEITHQKLQDNTSVDIIWSDSLTFNYWGTATDGFLLSDKKAYIKIEVENLLAYETKNIVLTAQIPQGLNIVSSSFSNNPGCIMTENSLTLTISELEAYETYIPNRPDIILSDSNGQKIDATGIIFSIEPRQCDLSNNLVKTIDVNIKQTGDFVYSDWDYQQAPYMKDSIDIKIQSIPYDPPFIGKGEGEFFTTIENMGHNGDWKFLDDHVFFENKEEGENETNLSRELGFFSIGEKCLGNAAQVFNQNSEDTNHFSSFVVGDTIIVRVFMYPECSKTFPYQYHGIELRMYVPPFVKLYSIGASHWGSVNKCVYFAQNNMITFIINEIKGDGYPNLKCFYYVGEIVKSIPYSDDAETSIYSIPVSASFALREYLIGYKKIDPYSVEFVDLKKLSYTNLGTFPPGVGYMPYRMKLGELSQGETISKTFAVWNCGGGTLNYDISCEDDWIKVSPSTGCCSGDTQNNHTVTVDTEGLTPGNYNTRILIIKSPIDISFTIKDSQNEAPVLQFSQQPLDFGMQDKDQAVSKSFEVWNDGIDMLNYTLSESCSWVSVSPTSGNSSGEHDAINVTVNTTGLSVGVHSCDISISSNGGNKIFTVKVNVAGSVSIYHPKASFCYLSNIKFFKIKFIKDFSLIFGPITIGVEVGNVVDHVQFYIDDVLVNTSSEKPFSWRIQGRLFGLHSIKVVGYNFEGLLVGHDEMEVFIYIP